MVQLNFNGMQIKVELFWIAYKLLPTFGIILLLYLNKKKKKIQKNRLLDDERVNIFNSTRYHSIYVNSEYVVLCLSLVVRVWHTFLLYTYLYLYLYLFYFSFYLHLFFLCTKFCKFISFFCPFFTRKSRF